MNEDLTPIVPEEIEGPPETPNETAPQDPPPTYRLADLAGLLLDDVENRKAKKDAGKHLGPIVPFQTLNHKIGECLPVGLSSLLGLPGSGKSALALQIAAGCGCPALYVSCEMPGIEQLRRVVARVNRIPVSRLKDGSTTREQVADLIETAVKACPELYITDATVKAAGFGWLRQKINEVRGDSEYFLLVLDSLHSWIGPIAAELSEKADLNEFQAVSRAIEKIVGLAHDLKISVLAIGEQNRNAMNGNSEGLNSAAGSRKWEYSSELLMTIHSPKKKDPSEKPKKLPTGDWPRTVSIDKNRNGESDTSVKFGFGSGYMAWEELPPGAETE